MSDHARALLRRHVIAALDTDTATDAIALAHELEGVVGWVKVGSKLFTEAGPPLLDALGALGLEVFLDLKYHDIPSVVGAACARAAAHPSVGMLTVHASGGADMIARAREGARVNPSHAPPLVVAVTALTSLSEHDASALGVGAIDAWVDRLAALAMEAGADGLVCSAREAARLHASHPEAQLVTPGIRPRAQMGQDDQTRAVTPADAIGTGARFLVIGRPIYRAENPRAAALAIGEELAQGAHT